jgi:microcystin-dependent protein
MASRSYFSYSVIRSDTTNLSLGGDAILVSLKDVDWVVKKVNSTSGLEEDTIIYSGPSAASTPTSGTTGTNGLIEFWADQGLYTITLTDTKSRIATKKIYWDSVSGQTNSIDGTSIIDDTLTSSQIKDATVNTADIASNAVTSAKIAANQVTYAKLNSDVTEIMPPIGTVMDYSGTGDPVSDRWILCDGRELSQSTYSALFTVVSTRFNTGGETSGNFRIPDFRGRVSAGPDNMETDRGSVSRLSTSNTLGAASGNASVSLTTGNIPKFDFTPGGSVTGAGGHSHGFSGSGSTTFNPIYNAASQGTAIALQGGTNFTIYRQNLGINVSGNVTGSGDHSHGFSGTPMSIGNQTPTNVDIRQPYLVVNKIIRIK